jgi:hypothetical protein
MLQRDGKYPGISHLTKTMGLEFSGIIARLAEEEQGTGKAQEEWQVGDEVFGLLYGGGYAEYVNVSTRMLIKKPKELSFEQTGGLCEVTSTFPIPSVTCSMELLLIDAPCLLLVHYRPGSLLSRLSTLWVDMIQRRQGPSCGTQELRLCPSQESSSLGMLI